MGEVPRFRNSGNVKVKLSLAATLEATLTKPESEAIELAQEEIKGSAISAPADLRH
jgi:hypothetical protein